MNILVLSGTEMAEEFGQKISEGIHRITYTSVPDEEIAATADVIFDFLLHQQPERLLTYKADHVVFCNAPFVQLASLVYTLNQKPACTLFGFNGLPTFFNRTILEVSMYDAQDADKMAEVCKALNTDYQVVEDRVGMVTPRVICMIINEACYTLQEGTASIADIDLGMKLGTNYPKGPFEWANQIGIQNVYKLLNAVYKDTREERYKICPLLKTKYLKGETFEV
ncbi:3-hydroxyacyl-CoA dehydrogenase family protein [Pontibacter arcticus]|uniref:3-hydroxyacyl-CoA dehydrogenase n=1 Tax=Pontibacter arcticus TaxID=2080288 RepID=A0A364RIP6_9BACT|nr:3-hydroxyacyl-CoA dehydrogenase family protein [Pontibacter arcticus]RAU84210.1 3-hydroxyacyl-CoA dehydrogenase [Pontibacter arcticus]